MNPIDYRELLKKYMAHVGESEGTHFTGRSLENAEAFTEAEVEELRRISDEVDSR